MKMPSLPAAALLCLGLGACSDLSTSLVCPARSGPSLVVYVMDAQSGRSVAEQASGTWSSGGVTDSLRHQRAESDTLTTVLAAFGPAGTYEVRVTRPGHADWVRNDVVVTRGQCGPTRAEFTATHTAVTTLVVSE
jgi:hypothetical protein